MQKEEGFLPLTAQKKKKLKRRPLTMARRRRKPFLRRAFFKP